jgi:RNA polymerase II subunit A C-terminal domain phosphatase
VWPRNRANLIKVTPYDFFKGVGDINSSFLPKREDLLAPPPPVPEAIPEANGEAKPSAAVEAISNDAEGATGSSKLSPLEELASMSSGEESTLRQLQADEQAKTLEKQIKDRPMLHMQETLDKQDQEAATLSESQTGPQAEIPPAPRHVLLVDDDHELVHLEAHLAALHRAYYKEYDATKSRDPTAMPNVGDVLSRLKSQVLEGTTIVLSGLVPLGVDVLRSDIGLQATSFGARIESNISEKVTHLVISSNRPRTQKVRQAARIPSIKIVNQDWLSDTLSQWSRKDETPYLVGASAMCFLLVVRRSLC